eukprot:NODE_2480_length_1192_cov_44.960630_g2263_i0.p1 GENE.NODE_2480_length_1192_cov_44.960630_g2263_i0~~NODE_2480_length_1192_cov_44.960630_g2263_i0.p1  ORF type:complete len:347 (+),score=61.74 NODE_2480_length_1192_cov_44.960630_g2263_i0:77-1042(+)
MKGFLQKIKDKKSSSKKESSKMLFGDIAVDVASSYELTDVVGVGTFSTVKLAKHLETGKFRAVKVIQKNDVDVKVEHLKSEVAILLELDHPNIVNLYEVGEDSTAVYLIMDLMLGGELFERICKQYPMGYSELTSSEVLKKIVEGVAYLHSKGIIHRDLKPENLLYASPDDDADIRISDFGLAKIYREDVVVKTACGSPNYVAPEVLLNQGGYGFAVDMWSVGVILYVLLCGFCPFHHQNTASLFKLIGSGTFSFPSPYWDHISDGVKDLISHLLEVDPTKRYTPQQVLEHPWVRENTSVQNIPNIVQQWNTFRSQRGCSE